MIQRPRALFRNRHLLVEMTRREIADRYAGQAAGAVWAVAHPLLLMGLYLLVFRHVFAVRFHDDAGLARDYPTYLMAGLVPWLAMQDVLARGSDAVLSHGSYVKQVAFPLGVLPVKRALASLPVLIAGTAFVLAYQLVVFRSLPPMALLWPLYLAAFVALSIGITCLLGALGVYFRDLREVVTVLTAASLFLLPILYLPGHEPSAVRALIWLNPFSPMIWVHQDLLFHGRVTQPLAWVAFPLIAVALLLAGRATFQRLSAHFGEVI